MLKAVISIHRRKEVEVLLNNETNSCSEITRVASFKNILAFTNSGAYQVKVYDPVDKVVTVLVGSGQKGNEDGAAKSCTFVQPHGICTVEETPFVSDAGTGNVELNELSGTTQFLKHPGLLYDSFGITCKGTIAQHITPQQMVQNTNLKAAVSKSKRTTI